MRCLGRQIPIALLVLCVSDTKPRDNDYHLGPEPQIMQFPLQASPHLLSQVQPEPESVPQLNDTSLRLTAGQHHLRLNDRQTKAHTAQGKAQVTVMIEVGLCDDYGTQSFPAQLACMVSVCCTVAFHAAGQVCAMQMCRVRKAVRPPAPANDVMPEFTCHLQVIFN